MEFEPQVSIQPMLVKSEDIKTDHKKEEDGQHASMLVSEASVKGKAT